MVGDTLEVKACPHGRGVFALKAFNEGDVIGTIENVVITTSPRSPPWKRWALIVGRTEEGEHLFWDEEPEGSPYYWSNFLDHSDRPNVRFLIDMANRNARLVALRRVQPGEELFLNYKEYDEDNWSPS